MAVVLTFPDRFVVGSSETSHIAPSGRLPALLCQVVILPCVRRESLDRAMPIAVAIPAQLQA